jgi:serine/threonine-protein kinase
VSAAVRICPQCGSEYPTDIKFCPKDGSTLRVPPGAALIGSIIADRYHILKKLGEGGMGQVFLAEHVKMGRPSAIKVMTPGMMQDADAISRFNREAANASRITHPNVAAIYDFGETSDGLIYLAMEYVEGEPLTAIIERAGALAPARAASIVRQTASALDAAHERGIVHRDLKPDNIMVARNRDGSDLVKVVDFGIAKSAHGAGQKVTKTGLVVGTPEYMSPEQLAGDAVDARSDTFALALVAFHALTGSLPYAEGSAQETMIRRLTDKPRTLGETRPGVQWPPALERAVAQGLERDAHLRPATSGEFAANFAAATEGMAAMADGLEGATHVMSAVPATRVANGEPGVSGTRPSTRATLPVARRRSPWLLVGGGLAVAAGVAVVIARGVAPKQDTKGAGGTQPLMHAIDSAVHAETSAATKAGGTTTVDTPVVLVRPAATPPAPKPQPKPAPPAPPPAAPPAAPPSSDTEITAGPGAAARARQSVERASQLIVNDHAEAAILLIRKSLPFLATHKDSVTAYYHLSEALLLKSEKTGDTVAKSRACDILSRIGKDPAQELASSISFLYGQECK